MRKRSSGCHIRLAALCRSQNVQVVQNVIHAAVIRQTIEQRLDRFFGFHAVLLSCRGTCSMILREPSSVAG
jgi:hypothetical protein